jgi:hypothetical protein
MKQAPSYFQFKTYFLFQESTSALLDAFVNRARIVSYPPWIAFQTNGPITNTIITANAINIPFSDDNCESSFLTNFSFLLTLYFFSFIYKF